MLVKTSIVAAAFCALGFAGTVIADNDGSALNHTAEDIDGNKVNLAEKYKGKVVLIVNVASECGFTPQYKGLQALHEQYGGKGLAVLGFPCNQFGGQEPGTSEDIKDFCSSNYNVKFDLFSKVDVNGDHATPLFKYLTSPQAPVADKGPVKWNFEKFLVGRDGKVVKRYRSRATPEQIAEDVATELDKG